MTSTIYLHGPHEFTASLTREGEPDAFVALGTGDASLFLHSRDECDALVRAALAARDLLPEPELPAAATHCPACGEAVSPVDGTCPMCPPALSRDLSGDLDAIPANRIGDPAPPPATHCPICGNKLGPDGRHVTQSGARIEYGPLRAGTVAS